MKTILFLIIASGIIFFNCDLDKIVSAGINYSSGSGSVIVKCSIPQEQITNVSACYGIVSDDQNQALSQLIYFDIDRVSGYVFGEIHVPVGDNRILFVNFVDSKWTIIRHVEYENIPVRSDSRFVITLIWK